VRCVFDDPWLAADYVLCMERTAAVIEGAIITARTCRVNRIIYAVSHKEKALGEKLIASGSKREIPVSMVLVGSKYPQRNKRELELVLRNYGKKEGIELGSIFMLGPSTLAAVFDAVKMRKAILERFVCVGGSAVRRPQIMKVRIGKRIGDLLSECGGFKGTPKRIATGSPLMGQPIADLNEPVTKTCYAIFATLEGNGQKEKSSCINCGECRNVCPVGLDPEELYKRSLMNKKKFLPGNAAAVFAKDCHGCGCCEIVCPSGLPLGADIAGLGLEGTYA